MVTDGPNPNLILSIFIDFMHNYYKTVRKQRHPINVTKRLIYLTIATENLMTSIRFQTGFTFLRLRGGNDRNNRGFDGKHFLSCVLNKSVGVLL